MRMKTDRKKKCVVKCLKWNCNALNTTFFLFIFSDLFLLFCFLAIYILHMNVIPVANEYVRQIVSDADAVVLFLQFMFQFFIFLFFFSRFFFVFCCFVHLLTLYSFGTCATSYTSYIYEIVCILFAYVMSSILK